MECCKTAANALLECAHASVTPEDKHLLLSLHTLKTQRKAAAFGRDKKSDKVMRDAEEKIAEHLSEMTHIKGKIPAGKCFGTGVCVYYWLIQTQ